MNAELDAWYSRDVASATYHWGVVIPCAIAGGKPYWWQSIAWFKTRRSAIEYAERRYPAYAIARIEKI